MGDSFSFDYSKTRRDRDFKSAVNSNDAYCEDIKKLKGVLLQYGQHKSNCSLITMRSRKCSCGYTQALKDLGIRS